LDAWVKLHTKKMQIPTRRLKKELHRQLMRSGPGYQKEGMITKEMNIQEDLLPSGIKEASISMKETTEEYIMNPDGLHHKEGPLTPRYQNLFLGHCYTCKNFGHKEINCIINEKNNYTRNMNGVNRRYGNNHGFVNRSYNSFSPLMDKNIVCYKCNYLGHKA
jgi:hypothetical protein